MPSTPDEFFRAFEAWQADLEARYFRTQGAQGLAVANAVASSSLNNEAMLSALPYKEQKLLRSRFRTDVARLHTLSHEQFEVIAPGGGGKIVGRLKGGGDDPLSALLGQMSIQYDPNLDVGERFSVSKNIPRAQYFRSLYERQQAGGLNITPGSRVFVFDTETLGLMTDASTVREISGMTMRAGPGGFVVDPTTNMTRHIQVGRAAFGSIVHQGATMRMDDYISNVLAGGKAAASAGDGNVFVKNAIPFLQQMASADYIAGHNVGFDISQVVGNIMKTSAYLQNEVIDGVNVQDLVRSVLPKLETGRVIDTMQLATEALGSKLKLAPEFAALGIPRQRSLENIMLQTNLVDLILGEQGGRKIIDAMLTGGQHAADVDTMLTAKLLQFTLSGELDQGTLGGSALQLALRKKVLTSYAPTPVSNIADVSHMSLTNFKRLYDEAIGQEGDRRSLRIMQVGTGVDIPLDRMSAEEWYNVLTDPLQSADKFAHTKMTLMEQHILDTRRFLTPTENVSSVIPNLGQWSRFSGMYQTGGGFLNRDQSIFTRADVPSDSAYRRLQERLAKSGMPFSGISMEERILTSSLSTAASKRSTINSLIKGTSEGVLAKVGEDLGISRFAARESFYANDSVTAMPLEVIKRAEMQGRIKTSFTNYADTGTPQMLGLSTVDSSQNVNLMLQLVEDDARSLVSWLEEGLVGSDAELKGFLRDYGLDSETMQKIKDSLESENLIKRGVNIGYIDGKGGTRAYNAINSLLQNLTRDEDKIRFRVGYMNSAAKENGKGVIRTGAVILDRFLGESERANYLEDLKLAELRRVAAEAEVPTSHKAISRITGSVDMDHLRQVGEEIYQGIRKWGPRGLGAAALVFGGYYGYKKHKEQSQYDEAFAQMDYQSASDYDRYREEMYMQPLSSRQKVDPLTYAGVVGNLDRAAVGHTRMGSDKHMGLFNGV